MRRNAPFRLKQLGPAAALLGALMALPAPAFCQDDATLTMARERFKEGVAHFDKKDFAKARVAFMQAYALKKHPAVLLNLAQSELRSGHEAEAAKHFAQYLREHTEATDGERQGAEAGLATARAVVGEVTLDVDAPTADVYVDGDLEGPAPLPGPLFLAPGAHDIEVRQDGKIARREVSVVAGQVTTLKLTLAAAPTPAAAATEDHVAPAPPGTEAATPTSSQGRQDFVPWLGSKPVAIVGVGLTGVGIVAGGAFALGAKSSYDAADKVAEQIASEATGTDGKPDRRGACVEPENWLALTKAWGGGSAAQVAARKDRASQYERNCEKYTSDVNSGDNFKKLAIVSFAVAGAAAVGTLVYYFVDAPRTGEQSRTAAQRRVVVLPLYQPGFAGGLVSGTF